MDQQKPVFKASARALILLSLAALSFACSPLVRNFGFAPTDAELSEIIVGVDTRDRVEELIGFPASESMIQGDAWYYLSARQETFAYREPQTTDRQLVAISFSANGTVRNIERFTLEDGRVVTLSRRVTDDPTKGVSFLRQMLGNLGNFDATQVLGEG
jgi:outer membrane protein assembly factor BamE (lipoprotein component of BamABCDE complex)